MEEQSIHRSLGQAVAFSQREGGHHQQDLLKVFAHNKESPRSFVLFRACFQADAARGRPSASLNLSVSNQLFARKPVRKSHSGDEAQLNNQSGKC
ncbi:hypothetical protein FQA47_013771 [Oryzias melastigma]|uniref:Uncharacterized protein n=1 Tax=Oryzias melastigma TaxID=30732 RepID=A0A834BS30_ORYME|nr:hypothetical protein FQA47_013771 [Oryzias melastigma]